MSLNAPGYGEHQFGGTVVTLSSEGADAVLPDGGIVTARPARTGAAIACAASLGYGGNTREMVREWCYLHAQLAHVLGLPCSIVLDQYARDAVESTPLADAERHLVTAAIKYLNAWRESRR